jgi:hypothetical protein
MAVGEGGLRTLCAQAEDSDLSLFVFLRDVGVELYSRDRSRYR